MPGLAAFLAAAFRHHCPRGWLPTHEAALAPELTDVLGYTPRADVCLRHRRTARRVWIELEISRADPVANHAKFAVAHGFAPQADGDVFVSMMTTHVDAGRRNLASAAILMMRQLGMSAFQTGLLPDIAPARIKQLNHAGDDELERARLPISRELRRAMIVLDTIAERPRYRIHFASDVGEVLLNARRWNHELADPVGRRRWGRRHVQYFVHDPLGHDFAPSKFCAFVPVPTRRGRADVGTEGFAAAHLMSLERYTDLDESEPRFDGNRARRHLEERLMMTREPLTAEHPLAERFERWRERHVDAIGVRGRPEVLTLPAGFR